MKLFDIVKVSGDYANVVAHRNEDELRPEVFDGLRVGDYRELSDDLEIRRVR